VRWIHGWQIASALLAAHAGTPLDVRITELTTVARGVDDWSSVAAVLGLRAIAETQSAARGCIASVAQALLPSCGASLPPMARALALLGIELGGDEVELFWRLRARVRGELSSAR
jgi:hypothetical protein